MPSPQSNIKHYNRINGTQIKVQHSENTFGLLVRHPRLVGERNFNSLDKQTQALADIRSDSLSIASSSLGINFTLLCILGCNVIISSNGLSMVCIT